MTVLVAGGGIAGLAMALTCHQLGVPVKVFESSSELKPLGVGINLQPNAIRELFELGLEADIENIGIRTRSFGLYSKMGKEIWIEPRGTWAGYNWPQYSVHRGELQMMLYRKVVELLGDDAVQTDSQVTGFENTSDGVEVTVADRDGNIRKETGDLLIAADGVRSKLRDAAGIKTMHWEYDQIGIVTTVAHERPHLGRAEEHFMPGGPFATLPLLGNRSSLVWTEPTAKAKRLLAADDFTFELELETRFGHKLGEISVDGPRMGFPLGLRLAREFVKPRFALVGDAAHGIHPISGQGLNLGFKDAAALAQTIVEADRLGLDIGQLNILERYQQWRRFDTVRMGVVTDVLNRLFSNDNSLLRAARTFGLGIVDRLPGLKDQFINQASGRHSGNPALLNGEAI